MSMKSWPHRCSFHGNSATPSSLIRNRRWKSKSLLSPGNRRWIVSWSMALLDLRAAAYRCGADRHVRYQTRPRSATEVEVAPAYLHVFQILHILSLRLHEFSDDIVASRLLSIRRRALHRRVRVDERVCRLVRGDDGRWRQRRCILAVLWQTVD